MSLSTSSYVRHSRRIVLRSTALLAFSLALAGPVLAQGAAPRVKLTTTAGDIVLELAPDKAPKTVANFLQYVRDRHYDGTVFHRVIDGFMIQGGGYTADFKEKATRAPVPLEAGNGLKNERYTVAMARTSNPDSATSQFFINVKDNANLDAPNPDGHGYTVFGKVVSGAEVVDKIRAVRTAGQGRMQNVPVEPITIQSATIVAK
jgi:peptidyl-prolyl cis-trans isomerase A (cyclophilin A)